MSQTGGNFTESVDAWSDITMKVLFQRMDVLGFGSDAGQLRNSLQNGRMKVSDKGNERYNLAFSFNLYGRFVDMGVGRGFSRNNSGDVHSGRKPKEWLSGYWWAQLQRLKEIMHEKYSSSTTSVIMDELSGLMGNAKTMKGFHYVVQQSKRNARNYARRRAMPGKWANNHKTWKPL